MRKLHSLEIQMDDAECEMARRCYGYGRWEAPYWFIGPEQGKSRKEPDGNSRRLEAWLELGADYLCDCKCFHIKIGDTTRHGEIPKLQSTWRPLILMLMAFLGKDTKKESLRAYQRDQWGMESNGETCVIELSGLAARNLKAPIDHTQFRPERIEFIRQKLQQYKPAFVIMYGLKDKESWEQIAEHELNSGEPIKINTTIAVLTPHPVSRGLGDQYWRDLGEKLRLEYSHSLSAAMPAPPSPTR